MAVTSPAGLAFLGGGLMLRAYNEEKAANARASVEEQNASWYREQADYAQAAGDRQVEIFGRQSKALYAEQASAFAKAGVDTQESSNLMAKDMFYRQQESQAIIDETNMNVRLSSLRATMSANNASTTREAGHMAWLGAALDFGGKAYGG